jgi:Raf kinase inhibitor-like YbhB/YbcL family protein
VRPALLGAALALLGGSGAFAASAFELTSLDVREGERIGATFVYDGYGCRGANRSPALSWQGAPAGTQSFALLVLDPDAPKAGGWWHWAIFDIPAGSRGLAQGAGSAGGRSLPAGSRQGRNDFGTVAWGGPCPPAGDKPHHYVFTLYALNRPSLGLAEGAAAAQVQAAVVAAALGRAQISALYGR